MSLLLLCGSSARAFSRFATALARSPFCEYAWPSAPRASLSFGFARTACCSSGMALPAIPESTAAKPCARARKAGSASCFCCSASCDCAAATLSPSLKIERYFFSADTLASLTGMSLICPYQILEAPSRPAFDFAICSRTAKPSSRRSLLNSNSARLFCRPVLPGASALMRFN